MQLHTLPVDNTESPYRELYRTAKDCLSYVEGSNIFSIRLLQAALLIALYEVSNAMYPAAYLSVGHCARLGHAMGIHDRRRAPQMLSSPSKFSPAGEAIGLGPDQDSETATELEERRRVWWAVIILDRYVNLGSKNRPFACEDARPDEYLPADDKHWDQGVSFSARALSRKNAHLEAPPFARTCQAAHLLSRVLRNLNDSDTDAEFRFQEAIQLHRTTQALYSTALHESEELVERMSDLTAHLPFSAAMGLCLSALLTLYDKYSCTENSEVDQMGSPNLLEMQKIAISGLKELSSAVFQLSRRIRAAAELGGMLKTSPLICDCLYQAAANYLWYILETGNEECRSMVVGIKDVLQMLGTRWKSPIEYIRILDSYEMSQGLAM
ncbi:uncharacterized protein TRUGW13939_10611 [Talaromyces rugulosus]|uniref:Xylanolytic transcriptional activator regulatory domain-containing protein n=1 Tax=Talaromyces rugulosus TaxID=121627 RepID=A0A7H8RCD5_TALRU|nr:uncharacterized protein TRUGW13939_10611 [Talaromyces rugulosus]QKX63441.1 hypothetical protein TRUGW13939_10611 [Talaromyces rugulosus]